MPYIGIDFGTSNSVVANFQYGHAEVVPNHEGQKWTPSVVTLRRDGSLAFGQEAKENFDEQRSIRSIKRILGTSERVPFVGQNLRTEQIAVMLFSLLKRDAEQVLGENFTKAVVTVPANSKGLARHATKLCAGAAGLQVLTLINEPTAAAITYGLNAQEDQTVLVYDFGGGTLDVTVLRIHHGIFEEISSKGIGRLGGDDLDGLLANVLFWQMCSPNVLSRSTAMICSIRLTSSSSCSPSNERKSTCPLKRAPSPARRSWCRSGI
jgi:molecular chaperone DnaK